MKATNLTDLSKLETESRGTLLKTPADATLPAALHKVIGIWYSARSMFDRNGTKYIYPKFFTALNCSAYMIHRNRLTASM
jgi:hypothetical protein